MRSPRGEVRDRPGDVDHVDKRDKAQDCPWPPPEAVACSRHPFRFCGGGGRETAVTFSKLLASLPQTLLMSRR